MPISSLLKNPQPWRKKTPSDFFKDFQHEIDSTRPPRKVGFRPFQKGRRAWIDLGLANALFLFLFLLFADWMLPFFIVTYGIQGSGIITDQNFNDRRPFLLIRYQSKDSKIHNVKISTTLTYYNGCSINQSQDLHYFSWLPSKPALDWDSDKLTIPEVIGPFVLLGYLVGYIWWFLSLRKEHHLFQIGVVAKGSITDVQLSSKSSTATVTYTYQAKDYTAKESYVGWIGEPVAVLLNPQKPKSRKIYFQTSSSIFEVKP